MFVFANWCSYIGNALVEGFMEMAAARPKQLHAMETVRKAP